MNPLSGKSIPSGVAPSISLPFGTLGVDGLSDASLSFATPDLSSWAGIIRGVLLFILALLFALHAVKIVSKALGGI
jgi:hypothetical protein